MFLGLNRCWLLEVLCFTYFVILVVCFCLVDLGFGVCGLVCFGWLLWFGCVVLLFGLLLITLLFCLGLFVNWFWVFMILGFWLAV